MKIYLTNKLFISSILQILYFQKFKNGLITLIKKILEIIQNALN
jgi:hypothetical protein